MMTFVSWKWPAPTGYRTVFGPEHVNILADMIGRHYSKPHRVVCVTNEPDGIDRTRVDVVPAWNDHYYLPPPSGGVKNPSCYRRLRMFTRDIGRVFGARFCWLDLDMVITGDLSPLVDGDEDFKIWGDTHPTTFYNGSFGVMNAGARPQVWEQFDPATTPQLARRAGHIGSDQAVISYILGPNEAKFTTDDGVYSFKNHIRPKSQRLELEPDRLPLPEQARVVIFHGQYDPWMPVCQHIPWVREHYRVNQSMVAVPKMPDVASPMPRRIVSCYFGEGFGQQFPRMARVLEHSARRHCPGWDVQVVALPTEPPTRHMPSNASNAQKKAHWAAAVEQAADGAEIALLDVDTMIVNPLDVIWAEPFDLAYTVKQGHQFPFNSGVVFVRANDRTRAFMRAWLDATRWMLANQLEHQAWRRKFGGISQAAFGYLLDTGAAKSLALKAVPCAIWNCEDSTWGTFNPSITRIVHLKSTLRRVVFHMGPSVPSLKLLAQLWRKLEAKAGQATVA